MLLKFYVYDSLSKSFSDSVGMSWASDSAFFTSSQMIDNVVGQGLHSVEQDLRSQNSENSVGPGFKSRN